MNSVIHSSNQLRVILFRDPRDALISLMFHMEEVEFWLDTTEDHIDVFLSMLEHEKIHFLIDMPSGIYYYFKFCSELMEDPRVIIFRFEDLIGPEGSGCRLRQEEALKKLALILGQAITTNEIIEIASQLFGNTITF